MMVDRCGVFEVTVDASVLIIGFYIDRILMICLLALGMYLKSLPKPTRIGGQAVSTAGRGSSHPTTSRS
jgi:hypothetical protein